MHIFMIMGYAKNVKLCSWAFDNATARFVAWFEKMLAFTKEKCNSYHNTDGYADIFLAVYYTVRDAVDWFVSPTTRWFKKGSNHNPFQFC